MLTHLQRFSRPSIGSFHSVLELVVQQSPLLRAARRILSCPTTIAHHLVTFNQYCANNNYTPVKGIASILGDVNYLEGELTPETFMQLVHDKRPMIDLGVSPIHGQMAHALQHLILHFELGQTNLHELFESVARSGIYESETVPNAKVTLWDELVDRPAPIMICNETNKPLSYYLYEDTINENTEKAILIKDGSVMDARSPEWLTEVIAMAPDGMIDVLKKAVIYDIQTRSKQSYQDIYVIGHEKELVTHLKNSSTPPPKYLAKLV